MSTSFLVVQAQRDLAQAANNQLSAVLDYVRSVIDFEALQEAGPAAQSASGASTVAVSGSSISSPAALQPASSSGMVIR